MADELVFYTNPMSRGRIVRWMLEEVGTDLETRDPRIWPGDEIGASTSRINPMGKVPRPSRRRVATKPAISGLPRRCLPRGGARAAAHAELRCGPYHRWLFLRRGAARGRRRANKAQGSRGARRPAEAGHDRLWQSRRGDRGARGGGCRARVSRRRPLQCGRRLRRLPHRLGDGASARSRSARPSSATTRGSARDRPPSGHARSTTPSLRTASHRRPNNSVAESGIGGLSLWFRRQARQRRVTAPRGCLPAVQEWR